MAKPPQFSERDLWDQAHALIEAHGEYVGDVIISQIRMRLADGDQQSAATWSSLAQKVRRLGSGPETSAKLQ